jgi:hypothetical protein
MILNLKLPLTADKDKNKQNARLTIPMDPARAGNNSPYGYAAKDFTICSGFICHLKQQN